MCENLREKFYRQILTAKAQSRKEVGIFWNRKKTGRDWEGEVGDKFAEAVSR